MTGTDEDYFLDLSDAENEAYNGNDLEDKSSQSVKDK